MAKKMSGQPVDIHRNSTNDIDYSTRSAVIGQDAQIATLAEARYVPDDMLRNVTIDSADV